MRESAQDLARLQATLDRSYQAAGTHLREVITPQRRLSAQQLSERAKRLVHPPEGRAIVSADASQIEFRMMVQYTRDQDAIRAYNENSKTDFTGSSPTSAGSSEGRARRSTS